MSEQQLRWKCDKCGITAAGPDNPGPHANCGLYWVRIDAPSPVPANEPPRCRHCKGSINECLCIGPLPAKPKPIPGPAPLPVCRFCGKSCWNLSDCAERKRWFADFAAPGAGARELDTTDILDELDFIVAGEGVQQLPEAVREKFNGVLQRWVASRLAALEWDKSEWERIARGLGEFMRRTAPSAGKKEER